MTDHRRARRGTHEIIGEEDVSTRDAMIESISGNEVDTAIIQKKPPHRVYVQNDACTFSILKLCYSDVRELLGIDLMTGQ
jgi:ssDNA-binding replication factor A large subunit